MKISNFLSSRKFTQIMGLLGMITFCSGAMASVPPPNHFSKLQIKQIVVKEALNSEVPSSLALALAKIESDFQANAISHKGARGVMQIMPRTALNEFGVSPQELWNPRLNIQLGIDFLGQLIKRYSGKWDLALSHYNSGRVTKSHGLLTAHPATRKYVDSVLRWEKRYRNQAKVWLTHTSDKVAWKPIKTRGTKKQTGRINTIWYNGEHNTDTRMRIKYNQDGKSYQASLFSENYQYKCQPGKVFLDGRLEEVKCEDGDSDDINAACNFDNECGQFVFGELGLVKRISSPSSSQAGNIIDFVPINKKAIGQLKHKLISIPLTKNHWVDPNLDRSSINNLVSSNRNFERYNSIPYSIWAISFYERLKRAKQTLDDFGHIKISHQF